MKLLARGAVALLVVLLITGVGTAAWLWHDGYRLYAVRTGSMTPSYPTGDLVIVAPSAHYAVGDVITFRSSGGADRVTTHRVHAITPEGLETKGDANETPDIASVAPQSVVGRVVANVPSGGFALVFLQQPAGIAAVATVLLALSFSWALFFPPPAKPESEPGGNGPRHARRTPKSQLLAKVDG